MTQRSALFGTAHQVGSGVSSGKARRDGALQAAQRLGSRGRPRVALVCMPWGSLIKPPLALAILKRCVASAGFEVDVHYLHVRFARAVGWRPYTKISDMPGVLAEWFFSQQVFGPAGTAQLHNSVSDLLQTPDGISYLDRIKDQAGIEESELARIANELVPPYIEDCASAVDWNQYLAIGFTTTFAQSLASLSLARSLKERHPSVHIIFGGANVDGEAGAEFVRAFDWVDYAVHGEAEESFPLLLERIASGSPEAVPGVSFRNGGTVHRGDGTAQPIFDLNCSPSPDYSDYFDELKRHGLGQKLPVTLYFESSRGCWWGAKQHCTFCGLNATTMMHRSKSAERVLSDILELSEKHKCLTIRASDNIISSEYFHTLLPALAKQDSNIDIFYEVKANLNKRQVALLAKAGVRNIQPGIESLCTRHLQLMRKGTTAIQNIQLLKWCREFGVNPHWNYLFGFPGEVPEDYDTIPSTMRLLMHLEPPTGITQVHFERFSPYQFEASRFGIELEPHADYRYVYPSESVDLNRVVYYFEGEWDGKHRRDDNVIEMKATAKEWRSYSKERSVFCFYEKGPGFIAISDNRPRFRGGEPKYRQVVLDAIPAFIYVHCEEIRTARSVVDAARKEFGNDITESQVGVWLERFVSHGLMFREGKRYLSLSTRKRGVDVPGVVDDPAGDCKSLDGRQGP